MPLDITVRQKRVVMFIHLLGFAKVFSKPIALSVAALSLAWFQDFILLQVENVSDIDFVMPVAKAVSSILALTLSGLSGFYAHSKWRDAREQQYMTKVDWLIQRGYLTEKSTASEIRVIIKEHFG